MADPAEWQEPEKLPGEFGFQVGHYGFEKEYRVQLPHHCDEWLIVWDADKDAATARVDQFISEAQAALARLREL